MISRRFILAALMSALLVLMVGVAGPSRAQASSGEVQFIEELAKSAIDALTSKDTPRSERILRFRGILNDNFAVDAIGRWALGKYWRQATDEEQQEYLALFQDLIVATYVDRFAEYAGEQLVIAGSDKVDDKDTLVHSRIERPGDAQPVKVDWRVRVTDQGTRLIYDVIVEGVSMAQTQRSEFGSVINREGRTVAGLLKVLREKTKTLQEQEAAKATN